LDSLDYFQRLPQERKKLLSFISDLHDNYETHSNPFHNFSHGVNGNLFVILVMHNAYLLSTMPANFNILTVKDIFVNVFSGLCHDIGHTGFTNAF
jgi:cAMP-specific phosphodiesterase 4